MSRGELGSIYGHILGESLTVLQVVVCDHEISFQLMSLDQVIESLHGLRDVFFIG